MLITCPNCGAKNRVDETRARTMDPVCGRCKTKLPMPQAQSGHPTELTDTNFDAFLQSAGTTPVLVEEGMPPVPGAAIIAEYLDETRGAKLAQARLMPRDVGPRVEKLHRVR